MTATAVIVQTIVAGEKLTTAAPASADLPLSTYSIYIFEGRAAAVIQNVFRCQSCCCCCCLSHID